MRPLPSWLLALSGVVALAAALALPASASAQATAASFGQLAYVESGVEQATGSGGWREAAEGGAFEIGERLRTGPQGLARLELPWMSLSLSPGSDVRVPDEFVLSAVLEKGRAVVDAEEHPVLKMETAEAEIRGTGRAVVRRESGRTLVTCLAGRFLVEGQGRGVSLSPGQGTVVSAGRSPSAAQDTPAPPAEEGLWPGDDPVFTDPGEAVELRWEADAPAYQVEILPVGTDIVLLQRDVGPPPARLAIPWSGAFRWRVAARNESGLEGVPSRDGLICVDIAE
ncbi:MAG: hypothetical protein PVJ73_00285 [Acidobacteriota bacterium]|jgi:hypothetical protein